jgi:hypothetical protein
VVAKLPADHPTSRHREDGVVHRRAVRGRSASAPIVTGYVIQITGSYNWAFGIAGLLLVAGATILLTMTRTPIEAGALDI